MGLSHSPKIVTNGLVLCLDAANKKSYPGTGTTWFDLSGKGYHGQLDNYGVAPVYSSAFSGTFNFSNNGKFYIDITELNNTNSYSVIWFGADGAGDEYGGVSRDTAWQTGNHLVGWRTGAINTDSGRDTNTNVSGSEFMICHTHNTSAKNVDQYLNGKYYGSFTYTDWIARLRWSFGARNATDHQYTGKIGAIQIYNRLLTAAEILQNFNALRGRFEL